MTISRNWVFMPMAAIDATSRNCEPPCPACTSGTGQQAREILKIGVFYDSVEETLAANGFSPNAPGRQQGFLRKVA